MSPDGSKTVSPEEKLLRLIRGKGQAAGSVARGAAAAPQAAASGTAAARRPRGMRMPAWWLTAINLALGGLVAGELTMLVLMQTETAPPLPAVPTSTKDRPGRPLEEPPPAVEAEPLPSLSSVTSRPMFHVDLPSAVAVPVSDGKMPAAQSDQLKELKGRLTLIGVVADETPQAIIEDSQTKKTHFVAQGQDFIEGIVAVEVQENRVKLEVGGQTFELSL